MKARDVFLIMLKHAEGPITGRTLIQKRAFFLDLKFNLGLNYRPHYYGPYSPLLDAAIGQSRALGFVDEKVVEYGRPRYGGFEIKRFDYSLTRDGLVVAEAIMKRYKQRYEQITSYLDQMTQAGDLDYNQLSVAAKAVWILKESSQPMTPEDVAEEAKTFGWKVSDEAIEKAVSFLEKLDIVSTENPNQA